MLTLIHGENQVALRQKLTELVAVAKSKNTEIFELVADKLDRAKLETALLSNSLFGNERLLVLENLHSLPKSKKKDEFINLISSASIDIILIEKKLLSKTDLKKLPADLKSFEFKVTAKLWSLLDQLSPNQKQKADILKLCKESVAKEGAEFTFLMIARQIRLLLQVKEGQTQKIAPFVLGKMKKQAATFSMEQLLELHHKLYQIDQKQKQSLGFLSLEKELDLCLLSM